MFFKPHPAYPPTVGGVIDLSFLQANDIAVLPARLPMEALLWAYPDIKIGGYNSSLYMSAKSENVAFFLNVANGSALTPPLNDLHALNYFSSAVFITV